MCYVTIPAPPVPAGRCPGCGRCSTCGHGNHQWFPPYQVNWQPPVQRPKITNAANTSV